MDKKSDKNLLLNANIWRYLVNFWTLVLYVIIIADFVMRNKLVEFLGPVSSVYIAALALYTAQKEFERWHDYNVGRHPGELYVFVWTILVIILLGLEVVYHSVYRVPSEVYATYVVVIGILAITRKSRTSYNSKNWDNL